MHPRQEEIIAAGFGRRYHTALLGGKDYTQRATVEDALNLRALPGRSVVDNRLESWSPNGPIEYCRLPCS